MSMRVMLYIWRINPSGYYIDSEHRRIHRSYAERCGATHILIIAPGKCGWDDDLNEHHLKEIEPGTDVYGWAMGLLFTGEATLLSVEDTE